MLTVISSIDYSEFVKWAAAEKIPGDLLERRLGFSGVEVEGVKFLRSNKVNSGQAALTVDEKIPAWMGGAAGEAQDMTTLAELAAKLPEESRVRDYFDELAEWYGQEYVEPGTVIGHADASAATSQALGDTGEQGGVGAQGENTDQASAGTYAE